MKIALRTGLEVSLTWEEVEVGAIVGVRRNVESRKRGLSHREPAKPGQVWANEILGACGEQAFAKAFGLYWDGSFNRRGGGDVCGYQVRTTESEFLQVRESDSDLAIWVLVTGREPDFSIRGWIRGAEAKRPEYWRDLYRNGFSFFVPASALNPLSELPGLGGRLNGAA
jgi:hypothetical protein